MSYQIRHKEWGIFQGDFLGLGCWHPMTDMPNLGIFKIKDEETAKKCIMILAIRYNSNDFSVEPFDEKLDSDLTGLKGETE